MATAPPRIPADVTLKNAERLAEEGVPTPDAAARAAPTPTTADDTDPLTVPGGSYNVDAQTLVSVSETDTSEDEETDPSPAG